LQAFTLRLSTIWCARFVALAFCLTFVTQLHAQKGGGASPAQATGGAGQTGGASTPFFETEMLAYGGMNQLSESVAQRTCKIVPKTEDNSPTVIIFDQGSFQNLQAWQSFLTTVRILEKAYSTLLRPDVAELVVMPKQHGGMLAAFSILGGADLAALITALSSSTTNTASTFTIQDSSMAVSLLHQMSEDKDCKGFSVIYYPLFGGYADPTKASERITDALVNVNKLRNYIQLNVPFSSNNDPRYLSFADLNTQYDQLIKSVLPSGSSSTAQGSPSQTGGPTSNSGPASTSPSAGGGQMSISLVQGAELNDLLENDDTYVLYADIVAAGGTQRDRKNVITLVTGDWISYSGGLIVNVALVNSKTAQLLFADTLRYRTANQHLSKPAESAYIEHAKAGDNDGVPGDSCTSRDEANWYERSLAWHEERNIRRSRL
jgi:hypothetical protein